MFTTYRKEINDNHPNFRNIGFEWFDQLPGRVILKSNNGNVTLFAFDSGQELSEHSTPYDALVEVLEGEVEIRISGVAKVLKSGQIIIMPANEPHAVKAISQFKMLLSMVK